MESEAAMNAKSSMKLKLTIAACLIALVALAESTCLQRRYGDREATTQGILTATTSQSFTGTTCTAMCRLYSGLIAAPKYACYVSSWYYDLAGQCHVVEGHWAPMLVSDYSISISEPKCDAVMSCHASMDIYDANLTWVDRVQCGWLR